MNRSVIFLRGQWLVFEDIYKFFSLSINSLSALSHRSAWFANQDSFNDPFEGIHKISESYSIEELLGFAESELVESMNIEPQEARKIVSEKYSDRPDEAEKSILELVYDMHRVKKEHARNLGVLSTSADIPNHSRSHIFNMLMWSHYGDGLRGFCINFDAKELYRSLAELNDESKFSWAKVKYDSKPHLIELLSVSDDNDFSYIEALQVKHEQWQYEFECRLFCNKTGLKKFSEKSVKSVYIGEKMSSDNESLIIDLIESNYPHAEICKVKIDTESYGIRVGKKI